MASHSSVLAWRIPGTGEPGGLPSMGSHRVGHDWNDLAARLACWDLLVENIWWVAWAIRYLMRRISMKIKEKKRLMVWADYKPSSRRHLVEMISRCWAKSPNLFRWWNKHVSGKLADLLVCSLNAFGGSRNIREVLVELPTVPGFFLEWKAEDVVHSQRSTRQQLRMKGAHPWLAPVLSFWHLAVWPPSQSFARFWGRSLAPRQSIVLVRIWAVSF